MNKLKIAVIVPTKKEKELYCSHSIEYKMLHRLAIEKACEKFQAMYDDMCNSADVSILTV